MSSRANLVTSGFSSIIYPNVIIGKNCVVEDFCIVGVPYPGCPPDQLTIIGDNCLLRSHTVIYCGNKIGNNFTTGNKANIRELNIIGNNVCIGTLSVIEHHVSIEDDVRIHSQAFIPEYSVLKKSCYIGPNVVITNAKYPHHPDAKKNLIGATIEENAKVGANVTLLPGVIVGANSLIGAGSVVTQNIQPNSIYFGNPAKFYRPVDY